MVRKYVVPVSGRIVFKNLHFRIYFVPKNGGISFTNILNNILKFIFSCRLNIQNIIRENKDNNILRFFLLVKSRINPKIAIRLFSETGIIIYLFMEEGEYPLLWFWYKKLPS